MAQIFKFPGGERQLSRGSKSAESQTNAAETNPFLKLRFKQAFQDLEASATTTESGKVLRLSNVIDFIIGIAGFFPNLHLTLGDFIDHLRFDFSGAETVYNFWLKKYNERLKEVEDTGFVLLGDNRDDKRIIGEVRERIFNVPARELNSLIGCSQRLPDTVKIATQHILQFGKISLSEFLSCFEGGILTLDVPDDDEYKIEMLREIMADRLNLCLNGASEETSA